MIVHSKVLKCSPIRSCCFGQRNIPTLTSCSNKVPTFFFKYQWFGGVDPTEDHENVPEILTKNFLESAFGRCPAGRAKNPLSFSGDLKERGSKLHAAAKPSAPGTSQFPAGKGGEGLISGNLQKKMLHGRTFVFRVAPRCDVADAADGWLDGRRSAPLTERTAHGGC